MRNGAECLLLRKEVDIMYLYNSATHKKEEFKTHTPGHVEMYTCGPTVYHFAHIGNLRSYIMEDVLEKYLRYAGYDVNRVMNITDVGHLTSDADEGEDKMLKGARREHKTVMEIAQFYTDAFFADCRKLNIKTPDVVQPATGLIPEFIQMVSGLLEKGYAYLAGGNVYFDTSKLSRYYVFNDHDEDDLAVGVREGVEEDTNKRNKNDFVLWFTKSKFEDQALKWDSPWGVGYPGWHIECSCISLKYNGEYLDLHCGGVDNAFPHHTNEIAQSESYLGHPWCPQWFHVAHLNTNDGKMSKSKGEFLTVSLLEEKGYDPLAYRYFCLQSHYRKALVFTWENLDNAVAAYQKLIARIAALKPEGEIDQAAFDQYKGKFMQVMGNDLNTSMGVTAVFDVLKAKTGDATKLALIGEFDQVLGLELLQKAEAKRAELAAQQSTSTACGYTVTGEGDPAVDALVMQRYEAKKAKNFAEADRIRDELKAQGIEIVDTKDGASWKRV
jgi:cysteinyl-tRNA synthetase